MTQTTLKEQPPAEMLKRGNFVQRFFRTLGPGVITGAADDDPSGIATYSIAGAQLGTSLL
jgi:Mn2+/Fe2+ NRAMP family transporter